MWWFNNKKGKCHRKTTPRNREVTSKHGMQNTWAGGPFSDKAKLLSAEKDSGGQRTRGLSKTKMVIFTVFYLIGHKKKYFCERKSWLDQHYSITKKKAKLSAQKNWEGVTKSYYKRKATVMNKAFHSKWSSEIQVEYFDLWKLKNSMSNNVLATFGVCFFENWWCLKRVKLQEIIAVEF